MSAIRWILTGVSAYLLYKRLFPAENPPVIATPPGGAFSPTFFVPPAPSSAGTFVPSSPALPVPPLTMGPSGEIVVSEPAPSSPAPFYKGPAQFRIGVKRP